MKNANRSLIVFAKKNRKPAISSTTHSRVLDPDDCDGRRVDSVDTRSPNAKRISQDGAKVEPGIHTAELLPVYNEDGSVHFKLMVR